MKITPCAANRRRTTFPVVPAQAGTQWSGQLAILEPMLRRLDTGLRRYDERSESVQVQEFL